MGLEKNLPYNLDAEKALLGSILYDPQVLVQLMPVLKPEDFYRDSHRTIYEAIVELDRGHQRIDIVTVAELLRERGQLEDVGDFSYLAELQGDTFEFHIRSPEEYARILSWLSLRRQLIFVAGKIAALAYEEPKADIALAKSEEWLHALTLDKRDTHAYDMADVTAEYIERLDTIQKQRQQGIILGVPTGFADLDRLTGGLQKGDLIVLAARPGRGKTALALSIARQVMHFSTGLGYRTLMFSLEMSRWQLSQRMLSMESGVNQAFLRTAWLDEEAWVAVAQAQADIPVQRLWVDDDPGLSVQEIRSRARRHQSQFGLDFVIVDYLQLMSASKDDGSDYQSRVEEVDRISRELKKMARELEVPVLALAQLSRAVETRQEKIPQLSDLRESGGIEQNSDIVIFPYENPQAVATPSGRFVDLIIAKHRQGECGTVQLFFRPALTRFEDIENPIPGSTTVTEVRAVDPPPPSLPSRQHEDRAWNDREER